MTNKYYWPWLFAVSDLLWQVVVKLNHFYRGVTLSGREEALQVIYNFYKRHPRSFILHLFHNTIFKSARTFPFLLLPLQRYHLRTRLQVRGNRPLALSKHCVLSGLWLWVVRKPSCLCLPGGVVLAREKERMVLFVWHNWTYLSFFCI